MSDTRTELRALAATIEADRPTFDAEEIRRRPVVAAPRGGTDPSRRIWRVAAGAAAAALVLVVGARIITAGSDATVNAARATTVPSLEGPVSTGAPSADPTVVTSLVPLVGPPVTTPLPACPANPWTGEHDRELGTGTDTSAGPRIAIAVPEGFAYTGSSHDKPGAIEITEDHYRRTDPSPAQFSVTVQQYDETIPLTAVTDLDPARLAGGRRVTVFNPAPGGLTGVDWLVGERSVATVLGEGIAADQLEAIAGTVGVEGFLGRGCG